MGANPTWEMVDELSARISFLELRAKEAEKKASEKDYLINHLTLEAMKWRGRELKPAVVVGGRHSPDFVAKFYEEFKGSLYEQRIMKDASLTASMHASVLESIRRDEDRQVMHDFWQALKEKGYIKRYETKNEFATTVVYRMAVLNPEDKRPMKVDNP